MTDKQKRQLVDRIIEDVRRKLDEGSWSYGPLQNDSVLDIRDKLIEKNDDNFMKEIRRLAKDVPENAWKAVGLCEFLADMHIKTNTVFFLKSSDLFELWEKAIDNCDDEEWFKEWDNPAEMRESIKKCRQTLAKFKKTAESK